MLSHEKFTGSVVLKNYGNPGSVVTQGPRFPGGVGVVFQLPSMGGARIFTGTALTLQVNSYYILFILESIFFINLDYQIAAYNI